MPIPEAHVVTLPYTCNPVNFTSQYVLSPPFKGDLRPVHLQHQMEYNRSTTISQCLSGLLVRMMPHILAAPPSGVLLSVVRGYPYAIHGSRCLSIVKPSRTSLVLSTVEFNNVFDNRYDVPCSSLPCHVLRNKPVLDMSDTRFPSGIHVSRCLTHAFLLHTNPIKVYCR